MSISRRLYLTHDKLPTYDPYQWPMILSRLVLVSLWIFYAFKPVLAFCCSEYYSRVIWTAIKVVIIDACTVNSILYAISQHSQDTLKSVIFAYINSMCMCFPFPQVCTNTIFYKNNICTGCLLGFYWLNGECSWKDQERKITIRCRHEINVKI